MEVKQAVILIWAQLFKVTNIVSKKYYHTCQVLGKSKSETAGVTLIFAYNLVIERAEKPGAQVLRVRFFSLFNRHKLLTQREISNSHFIRY